MGEYTDKTKGVAKEAAGRTTGDRSLEAEGRADQTKGRLKGAFENIKHDLKRVFRGSDRDRHL